VYISKSISAATGPACFHSIMTLEQRWQAEPARRSAFPSAHFVAQRPELAPSAARLVRRPPRKYPCATKAPGACLPGTGPPDVWANSGPRTCPSTSFGPCHRLRLSAGRKPGPEYPQSAPLGGIRPETFLHNFEKWLGLESPAQSAHSPRSVPRRADVREEPPPAKSPRPHVRGRNHIPAATRRIVDAGFRGGWHSQRDRDNPSLAAGYQDVRGLDVAMD